MWSQSVVLVVVLTCVQILGTLGKLLAVYSKREKSQRILPFSGKSSPNLRHYETLHVRDLSHRLVKRGATFSYHPYNTIKEVSFRTLGKNFRLILNPHKEVVHENFKAYEVTDSDGPPKPVHVDHDEFFSGRVFGEEESSVRAHIDADGVLTATVILPNETYHIEPAWRHLDLPAHGHEMIAYRVSDVILSQKEPHKNHEHHQGHLSCGFVKEGHELETEDGEHTSTMEYYESLWNQNRLRGPKKDRRSEPLIRAKRQSDQYEYTPTKTRCPLLLVADYRFFQEMGGGNTKTTINYLVRL